MTRKTNRIVPPDRKVGTGPSQHFAVRAKAVRIDELNRHVEEREMTRSEYIRDLIKRDSGIEL